jgi:hypothetical protein
VAAGCGSGIVNQPDVQALGSDDQPRGKLLQKLRLVHVSVDSVDGAEPTELLENCPRGEVTHMERQVGSSEQLQASFRKAPGASGQVRIAEERDQGKSSRNRPSR